MCLVIDTCCLSMVFDPKNKNHRDYIPVLNWINGKGRMIYGGTKYNEELGKAARYLAFVTELSRKRRTIQIPNSTVDQIAAELKRKCPEAKFDDEHIVALVLASRCCVVCTNDSVAIAYLKSAELFPEGSRPKIYRGRPSHKALCCDDNIVGLCR